MRTVLSLNAHEADLESGVMDAINSYFPYEGKKQTLEVKKLYAGDKRKDDDFSAQKSFRTKGKTWGYSVYGDFVLKDKSGKVVGSANKVKLATIPQITKRYSYIVGGNEYQADKQWRLSSGVYTRRKDSGELETQFNLAKGSGFRMLYDPIKKSYNLQYGTSNIPLYAAMNAMGVSDSQMKEAWGSAIFEANKRRHKDKDYVRLAQKLDRYNKDINTPTDAQEVIRKVYGKTELRPDTTKITLGQSFDKITGPALLRSSEKLLNVHRGKEEVDNRDSLLFKDFWSIEDHLPERISNSRARIKRRLANNVDRQTDPRRIVPPDTFDIPIKSYFTSTSLSQQPSQVNPLDMINGHLRTTILGTGGISTEQAVTFDAKLIDPSQLGFLDPVATPEGKKTGITTHLGLGVGKIGNRPALMAWSVKSGKYEMISSDKMATSTVAFPDSYEWSSGKPKARESTVTVTKAGDPDVVKPGKVEYILAKPTNMFSMTTNLIPFLPSTQAGRAEMATRHLEQAIALSQPEPPLVQSHTGSEGRLSTFEKLVGNFISHTSPVDGKVTKVAKDSITVKDSSGKSFKVPLYDHYPLNDKKAFIHSKPLVSVGDTVKAKQVLADNTFTKDGVLALGTNLHIAYLPFRGLTFEDGIVISETAAEKLRSPHLYKPHQYLEKNMSLGLSKFRSHYPGVVSDENAKKLDDQGVIKVGQIVKPGDVVATILAKKDPRLESIELKGIHKSLDRAYADKSLTWDKSTLGIVTDVIKHGNEVEVHIKTDEKADVGDKLSGRYGNKGVITAVLPDEEMPHDKDGNPIEIIVNPSGVPGRINPSQIHETRLAKVAAATGDTYAIRNFEPSDDKKIVKVEGHYRTVKTKEGVKRIYVEPYEYERDYGGMVERELRAHGMTGEEELIDPESGTSLGSVMVGHQYILKQRHQVDKKLSARAAGSGYAYDANLVPKSGGGSGGQTFGGLGLFAMLAHGAVHNIRDGLTYKSDQTQNEVWSAVQAGMPLPAPQPSFAYEKFLGYLAGTGVNVEKKGNMLVLSPLTDEQILEKSNGELTDATKVLRGKDLKPEKGGLFDMEITGGPGGKGWSHIKLAEPIPNPVFEKAVVSLLGLKQKDYDAVLQGKTRLDETGKVVESGGKTGAAAIVAALANLNEDQALAKAESQLETARRGDLDKVNKRIKYLKALKRAGLEAQEAYTLSNLPVLPPIMRPISALEGGDLSVDGLNLHYREVSLLNDALLQAKGVVPDEMLVGSGYHLYSAVRGLMGSGTLKPGTNLSDGKTEQPPGIMDILSGRKGPKTGYFLKNVVDRRQDLVMRSVIVPDLDLSLNEVGLPRVGAMKMFQPFVMRELQDMNMTPLQARKEIEDNTELANRALDVAVSKRPVLFKRDPVLYKYGIQAFNVKLHDQKSIHIHPLVVGGFNADFDGDTMAVFVPVSEEAVQEAYQKMMPQKNIFDPGSGRVKYMPSLEGQLGLFLLSQWGKDSSKKFSSLEAAAKAYREGEVTANEVVKAGSYRTTPGRAAIYTAFPDGARETTILTDPKFTVNSKNLGKMMSVVGRDKPKSFIATADRIKELGWGHSHSIGFSFQDSDFRVLYKLRSKHLKIADKKVAALPSSMNSKARSEAIIKIYSKATSDMSAEAKKELSKQGSALYTMHAAGTKPGWSQLQQLVLAPMLLENAKGEVIPVPVRKSYTEGLTTAGYWITSSGARKGLIEKVQSVSQPGALSKQIVNTTMGTTITNNDCGTDKGISLDIDDMDLIDRFTAKPFKVGSKTIPRNTLLTARLKSELKDVGVNKVVVRSSMKCAEGGGICSHCYGVTAGGKPLEKGTNIGVIAGQAIGERGMQLSMKQFHTGGVASGGSNVVSGFNRVSQIVKMPLNLPGQATLAPVSGTVTGVRKSPSGGYDVQVGTNTAYVPVNLSLNVKKGDKIRKGDAISSGPINPRQLLELTDIDRVQRYLADELHSAYASEGIKKRNIEVVTRSLTNLAVVDDPGDVPGFIRGDMIQASHANHLNTKTAGAKLKFTPVLKGVETLPLDQTEDFLARLHYRRLKDTIQRGAAEGWQSDIHGVHPVPGIVYSKEFGKSPKGGPY